MNVPVSCAGSGPIIPSCPPFCGDCTCIVCIDPASMSPTTLPRSCCASQNSGKTQLLVPLGTGF